VTFALSQNVFENANKRDDERHMLKTISSGRLFETVFLESVSLKSFIKNNNRLKSTRTAAEEITADIRLRLYAVSPEGINVNNLPKIVNKGYPVGCAILRSAEAVVSSSESIHETVGARVII